MEPDRERRRGVDAGSGLGSDRRLDRRICVLGLGSVLMGDDGVGPLVVERLRASWDLPSGVELVDAGTPGPDLFHYLEGWDAVVVVDTVRADAPPGTVRLYRGDSVRAIPASPRLSPHDPDLRQAMLTTEMAGTAPGEVMLVGIVPGVVELGTALSPEVEKALPAIERAVTAELRRLGVAPVQRPEPAPWAVWWQASIEG